MECSEKIINNCDVLEAIFHYLDFDEHLKLIKICSQFEYAVVHGVWRLKCKNLSVLQWSEKTFLLECNAVNGVIKERLLAAEAIHKILYYSLIYIQKLELNNIRCLKDIISFNYHHLTELSMCGIIVDDSHIQQVAKNCLKLQSFALKNFTNSIKQSNFCVNVFGEMKALKKLEIYDMNYTNWNYYDYYYWNYYYYDQYRHKP